MLMDQDAHAAVTAALSEHAPGSLVSTRDLLTRIRILCDDPAVTDDDLLLLVVREAIGRTMIISFDHRGAARPDGNRPARAA